MVVTSHLKKLVKLDYFPNFPGKKNNKSLQPPPTFGPQEPMESEPLKIKETRVPMVYTKA